jgi:hypothetical protein
MVPLVTCIGNIAHVPFSFAQEVQELIRAFHPVTEQEQSDSAQKAGPEEEECAQEEVVDCAKREEQNTKI